MKGWRCHVPSRVMILLSSLYSKYCGIALSGDLLVSCFQPLLFSLHVEVHLGIELNVYPPSNITFVVLFPYWPSFRAAGSNPVTWALSIYTKCAPYSGSFIRLVRASTSRSSVCLWPLLCPSGISKNIVFLSRC